MLWVGVLAFALVAASEPGFEVVVHESNPTTSISLKRLSQYFLGKRTSWPDGRSVQAIDLELVETRVAFCRTVHGKSVRAVRAYWLQQLFSGRGVPPEEAESAADVVRYVASHPNAIGYVPVGTPIGDLKVLEINE